ncbi:hypothetical protein BBJ28_00015733 [Nothophytophthora sp. Chile5]|nr:hypothetical protein BBJ28_00015733 [Nothophytophthora sp. Chile5]
MFYTEHSSITQSYAYYSLSQVPKRVISKADGKPSAMRTLSVLLRHAATVATARHAVSATTRRGPLHARLAGSSLPRSLRFNSSNAKPDKPLGLKEGVVGSGVSPTMQMLAGYVAVGVTVMAVIARYKSRDEAEEEVASNVRIFNMAKRAVVKDRRVFEAVGYPKTFEQIKQQETDDGGLPIESKPSEGSFRVLGDNGSATVYYRQNLHVNGDSGDDETSSSSDIVTFDLLRVELDDGTEFSALESFLENQGVVTTQKSQTLGKKLFFPVMSGVVIGGLASFFVIRILRNRPFYVHKLVLDHVNNHDMARQLLGHPIKSDRTKYVGVLTNEAANYTIACSGPKGDGTLIVKAFKKEAPAAKTEDGEEKLTDVMATPGTAWKFSTLVLSVSRNEKRKAKAKNAKTINLLSNGDVPAMPSQRFVMARLAMAPYAITLTCMLLRSLQLICSLVAIVTVLMAFPASNSGPGSPGFRLGSIEATVVLLVAYTSAQYSGAFLALVELFPVMLRPRALVTRLADALLAVAALSAGIVLAVSDYAKDCDQYEELVDCSNMTTASVFAVLAAVPFAGSVWLTFVTPVDPQHTSEDCTRNRAGSYRLVATPISSTLSPIDNRDIVTA